MAKAFAAHKPFLFMGHVIDYPAVLYPVALSLVFHVADGRLAFDLARGLNAVLVSAVVFPAYGLARQFVGPSAALAACAVAGLAPGGVYSALIMEENLYYPLFVLSCWLCFRSLTRGTTVEAVACALALWSTYITKPLGALLVAAYAASALVWCAYHARGREFRKLRDLGLLPRLLPLIAFVAVLLVRRVLSPHGDGGLGPPSELVLSRFYIEELNGPLVPSIRTLGAVAIALCAALTLGTGVVPGASLLSFARSMLGDRRRAAFVGFTALVIAIYVAAAARHTLVVNPLPRIHERYLFAAGPLLITVPLLAGRSAVGPLGIVLICAVLALAIGPLGYLALTDRTWVDAPSLILAWQARRALGGARAAGVIGSVALAIMIAAWRLRDRPWVRFGLGAGVLLALNAGWYATLYSQTHLDGTTQLVHQLQRRVGPADRITVVAGGSDALTDMSKYLKFWLDIPVTTYWVGEESPPWYVDLSGPPADAVDRTGASYVVAGPGFETACPAAEAVRIETAAAPRVVVLQVPRGGCRNGREPAPPGKQ
jgi:hypothetical protein